jgi:hypothetical protein
LIDYGRAMRTRRVGTVASISGAVFGALVTACQGADAPKAWSTFAACLAGPAAASPVVERVQKLRAAQLAGGAAKTKDAWPARCSGYADTLFSATGSMPVLNRAMKEKLGCKEGGHCTVAADDSFIAAAGALWDGAEAAKLKAEPATDVPAPALAPPPLADATSWKSFSSSPARVVGPRLNPDGSATLLLVAAEGRSRPRLCRLAAGFAAMTCADSNAGVPELPAQSVALTRDTRGPFAAGLTDAGLSAFNLETGARSDVRGKSPFMVSEGVAIETEADAPEGSKGAAAAPNPKASPSSAPKGFVAIEIANGKASKETKVAIQPVGTPITIGNQIVFVAGEGANTSLEAKAFSKGQLKSVASAKGAFIGRLHTCTSDNRTAVAAFGGYAQQQSAKPTAGSDKTQFAIAFRTADSWSKAQQGILPFDRSLDSDLVCSKTGASVAWVRRLADAIEVGRLDCNPDGCTPHTTTLAGLESKWWGGVAPLGDKVMLLWRSTLGETRLRVGSLAELGQAPDQLLFDSADFGGPVAGESMQIATELGALFVFPQQRPVALRVGPDGSAKLLVP